MWESEAVCGAGKFGRGAHLRDRGQADARAHLRRDVGGDGVGERDGGDDGRGDDVEGGDVGGDVDVPLAERHEELQAGEEEEVGGGGGGCGGSGGPSPACR